MKKHGSPLAYLSKTSFLFIFSSFLLMTTQPAVREIKGAECTDFKGTQVNEEILRGINLLYDDQFDLAEDIFSKVVVESPKKPEGYFYLAMVTWSRLASGFWTSDNVKEFKDRLDRTIQVARRRIDKKDVSKKRNRHGPHTSENAGLLQSDGIDSYDYFFLGGALGFKGRFEMMRGKWLSSFFLASDAIEALKTCSRMDPSNKDVLLGIGTFDYYTAHLSGVLKFLTYLLLHRGSKKEGLRKLHLAAEEGIYSATESKSMLLHIYLFLEEDFAKALCLAEDLATRYEENSRYKVLKGVSYMRLGMYDEYRDSVCYLRRRSLLADSRKEADIWGKRALYLETVYDLFKGEYDKARSKIRTILNQTDPESDPAMIAWPLIKMGISYDLEGKREKATEYYRKIINMENGSGAQFLAKKLLDSPTKKDDPFIAY